MVPNQDGKPVRGNRSGIVPFATLYAVTGVLALVFASREFFLWREMNAPLLLGTVALAAAVLLHAWRTASARNALLFFGLACGIPLAAEYTGIHWGIPFGVRFRYHADLQPRLLGCVPLFIPLAWLVLAYSPIVLLRQWRPAHSRSMRRWLLKSVSAAAMLCIADFSLDPLAVAVQAWTWEQPGAYFGIPASNYWGWFVVGLTIYGLFFMFERPAAPCSPAVLLRHDRYFVAVAVFLTFAGHFALVRHVPGGAWVIPVTAVTSAPGLIFWASHRDSESDASGRIQ